jgi:bleomycin hydrolase
LSVPDNWMQAKVYNVPMDDLVTITNQALQDGYSVGWGCDVSEKGFSHRNGVAINPEKSWEAMTKSQQDSAFHHPVPQAEVTQEMRQETYNNYQTTDDHMMHLTGLAEDQNGNPYYLVKNSWGQNSNQCGGYLYATESYFKAKTLTIVVHKDAVPSGIANKLGF